ncbi:MAG: tRNA-dihydrouridine synthase [Thermoguttaceae bacterium]|nr:tRNA-dihydrouridine synthase [Thermoguttaceae bacterium]
MIKTLQIGSIPIDPPFLMAPMAGFTNRAYRDTVRALGGCGLPALEMISARGFVSQKERVGEESELDRLRGVAEEPRPLAAQIWDNDPGKLAMVGAKLAYEYQVSVVDINFGCPAHDVAGKAQSGSFLLRDPERVGRLVERVVKACHPTPVTAKIRLGIAPSQNPKAESQSKLCHDEIIRDQNNIDDHTFIYGNCAGEIAVAVEQAGAAALTVHGRYAKQMFSGTADWDAIAAVKSNLNKIPLIGNGDIDSPGKAVDFLKRYPVDGIMIGRAAIGRPWLFRQASELLLTESERSSEWISTIPIERERTILFQFCERMIQQFGDERGMVMMRKFACRYGSGRRGAREFRRAIGTVHSQKAFQKLVDETFQE